jgi:glycosyltransferase involved in cell wall biosynthesis
MDAQGELAAAGGGQEAPDARPDRALSVSIVLPAYNEAANIEQAVAEATAAAEKLFVEHEVIVVDDGSSDDTRKLVKALAGKDPRVRVICHGRNRGYGESLRTGFLSARLDYVFFTDADLQFDLTELERFMPYAGAVGVIAGYRINRQDPPLRKFNARAWNLLVRVLFYVPVRDIDCAFKLFDRRALEEIDIQSVGAMVNTELMVKLGRQGASVVEIGVTHRPRKAGDARGANLRVIAKAFVEVARMRRHLASLDAPEL